jgi:osmoprotectant transport system permease protein
VSEQLALLPGYLAAHLALTLGALAVGLVVSVPAGVLVTRVRRLEAPLLGLAGVVQTVPSLALLAFMVPALAALGAPGIGFLPAFIGLCLYSVLPILRNTVTGLATLDPALIEAARGVGMTPGQQLRRVELPLALPVIVAGVRTAAVWTVGTATLSTPVGAPSLGNYIFSGLQTRNYTSVLVGCVAAAALALLLDALVRLAETGLRRRRRAPVAWAGTGFALLALVAIWPLLRAPARAGAAPVRIGSKTFTEQYILGRVLAGWITRATGLPAETVESLGSTVVFDALRGDQIDACVDYSGTLWANILKRGDVPRDRAEVRREVARALAREFGVRVVAALGFENTYALAVRRADAERLRLRRIGDLAPHAGALVMGGDYELFQRPEWRAIVRAYGLSFRELRSMDPSLMYDALASGGVDVISAFSTDGRIVSRDLVALDDDRGAIPPYDALVLVSPRLQREHPAAVAALARLEGTLDAERMRRLNAAVDERGLSPAAVAERFLRELAEAAPAVAP